MKNYHADRINNHKRFYQRRKELRNNSTLEEKILWGYLKNSQLGFKFRRQHSVGGYILDFYCPAKKLGIELDGDYHNTQKDYDFVRDKCVSGFRIKIIRFLNNEFLKNPKQVLNIILDYLNSSPD